MRSVLAESPPGLSSSSAVAPAGCLLRRGQHTVRTPFCRLEQAVPWAGRSSVPCAGRCIDESIDELAAYLGVGEEVAEMTRKYGC